MQIQHHTNDEVTINSKRVGWAQTYLQARTKGHSELPKIETPQQAFVFWPMTDSGVRAAYVVVNEPLYDGASKLNVTALAQVAS